MKADRVGALLLLALAVGYAAVAFRYPYWGAIGPGSGFMPRWLGIVMAILALLFLAGTRRAGGLDARWLPQGAGLRKLVVVVVVTALFVALLRVTGMILGTALFLLVVLRLVEGYPWRTALGVAVGAAAVNYVVFTAWLRVPFPTGLLGF